MSYEDDPDLMAAVDRAAIGMLGKVIEGAHRDDDPYHQQMRRAAAEICRRAGILDILLAVSADGALRPPPPWPACDIVPVGGGPGFLTVEVRTWTAARGVMRCPLRVPIKLGREFREERREAVLNAYDKGRWTIKRWLEQ
jgi:hypothetical protein